MKKQLTLSLLLTTASALAMSTPETSKLFVERVDPESGIRSYMLRPGIYSENQQSTYFVMKCMTDDGRFMIFLANPKESDQPDNDKSDSINKGLAVIDFETETIRPLRPRTRKGGFYVDTAASKIYTVNENDGFLVYDLNAGYDEADGGYKYRKLCDFPKSLLEGGTLKSITTHMTLTHDRARAFILPCLERPDGTKLRRAGCVVLATGEWEEWLQPYFFANHDQINPVFDDVAMCAWEESWLEPGITFSKQIGYSPRMWHLYKDGRTEYIPPFRCNGEPTHETWTRDGLGHYWVSKPFGVWYMDLKTGNQRRLSPYYAEHPNVTDDRNYIVYDQKPRGWWRGAAQRVGFWNNLTKRNVWIYGTSAPLCPSTPGSRLHPDAHPQFTCNDKYVVCTICQADGHMDLLVTPTASLIAATARETAIDRNFCSWPAGKDPATIGRRLCERFVSRTPIEWTHEHNRTTKSLTYPTVCTWYGALEFCNTWTELYPRSKMIDALTTLFKPVFNGSEEWIPPCDHVDNNMFACLPLTLYASTGDVRQRDLGLKMADAQWRKPTKDDTISADVPGMFDFEKRLALWEEGYTQQTRLWMDDMFMITIVQLNAYKATGDRKYADRAGKEMVMYLDKLQNPDGLFYHGPGAPYVWGRGNGWMAAGMAMLLKALPLDNENRPRILEGYRKMMAALLKHQQPSGMWGQLVDDPTIWAETSGTAMFAYAFIEGVKHGWLDGDTYAPAARKAFLALTDYIEPNGDVRDVCCGTNIGDNRAHYAERPRITGDLHGQAPVLWCCAALAEYVIDRE